MTYSYVPWHVHMRHDSFASITLELLFAALWHDLLICAMKYVRVSNTTHLPPCDMTHLPHPRYCYSLLLRDMTYSYVSRHIHMRHDSFASSTLLLLYAAVWHDLFICEMTYLHVTELICIIHVIVILCCWHDLFMYAMTYLHVTRLICLIHVIITLCFYVTWLIHMRRDSITCGMPY